MICPNCGTELQEGDAFCCRCGYKVEKPIEEQTPTVETFSPDEKLQKDRCPNCGANVQKDSLFCERCGYRLSVPANHSNEPELNVPIGDAGFVKNGQPEMICAMCGCKIPASSRVCPICQQPTVRYARDVRRVYRYEERPRVQRKPFNVFALLGFIFGLLGLLMVLGGMVEGIVLAIPGLVLSIIGLVKSKKTKSGKGFAITGLVLSSVAIVIFVLALAFGVLELFTSSGTGSEPVYPDMDTDFWGNGNLY